MVSRPIRYRQGLIDSVLGNILKSNPKSKGCQCKFAKIGSIWPIPNVVVKSHAAENHLQREASFINEAWTQGVTVVGYLMKASITPNLRMLGKSILYLCQMIKEGWTLYLTFCRELYIWPSKLMRVESSSWYSWKLDRLGVANRKTCHCCQTCCTLLQFHLKWMNDPVYDFTTWSWPYLTPCFRKQL